MGKIRKKSYIQNNLCFEISYPEEISKYIIRKGSIAVDGISLTIADVRALTFTVYIIPHTFKNTNLQFRRIGDKVNLECDFLAKILTISKNSTLL
jgi:riboflavin synthase